jgi:hypothetical protein
MDYDFALATAARPSTVKRTKMFLIIDATSPFCIRDFVFAIRPQ